MSRPQQQQPQVMDDLNARIISKEQLEALVEFRGQWYRIKEKQNLSSRSMHFFDTVVTVHENHYTVVKDRRGDRNGFSGVIDMLKVQLFTLGKTLDDLPVYYEDITQPYGALSLHIDEKGNLVAMNMYDDYEEKN